MIELKKIYVGAAIITNDKRDKIFVTKRQGGEFDGLWEFPGGKVEEGETSSEATIREIKEELSVDISVIDFFMTIKYKYDSFHLEMDLYWSTIEKGTLILNEHSDSLWISKLNLIDLDWVPADIQLIDEIVKSNFLR